MFYWYYQNNNGKWIPYSTKTNEIFNTYENSNKKIRIGSRLINFKDMIDTELDINKSYKIQKQKVTSSSYMPPPSSSWDKRTIKRTPPPPPPPSSSWDKRTIEDVSLSATSTKTRLSFSELSKSLDLKTKKDFDTSQIKISRPASFPISKNTTYKRPPPPKSSFQSSTQSHWRQSSTQPQFKLL